MNLHEWITSRVDAVERLARETEGGTTETALRRCEADRRILARHKLNPNAHWYEATMCDGCGWQGDPDYPATDNINDCPELLDLAHAHGFTETDLAALDRPEMKRPEAGPVVGYATIAVTPRMTAEQTPATFRKAES